MKKIFLAVIVLLISMTAQANDWQRTSPTKPRQHQELLGSPTRGTNNQRSLPTTPVQPRRPKFEVQTQKGGSQILRTGDALPSRSPKPQFEVQTQKGGSQILRTGDALPARPQTQGGSSRTIKPSPLARPTIKTGETPAEYATQGGVHAIIPESNQPTSPKFAYETKGGSRRTVKTGDPVLPQPQVGPKFGYETQGGSYTTLPLAQSSSGQLSPSVSQRSFGRSDSQTSLGSHDPLSRSDSQVLVAPWGQLPAAAPVIQGPIFLDDAEVLKETLLGFAYTNLTPKSQPVTLTAIIGEYAYPFEQVSQIEEAKRVPVRTAESEVTSDKNVIPKYESTFNIPANSALQLLLQRTTSAPITILVKSGDLTFKALAKAGMHTRFGVARYPQTTTKTGTVHLAANTFNVATKKKETAIVSAYRSISGSPATQLRDPIFRPKDEAGFTVFTLQLNENQKFLPKAIADEVTSYNPLDGDTVSKTLVLKQSN